MHSSERAQSLARWALRSLRRHLALVILAILGIAFGLFYCALGALLGAMLDELIAWRGARIREDDSVSGRAGQSAEGEEGRGISARDPEVSPFADACAVLGLPPTASLEEGKKAYRALALAFHPDSLATLGKGEADTGTEAFIRIEEAWRLFKAGKGD